jgi:hypothetical protein
MTTIPNENIIEYSKITDKYGQQYILNSDLNEERGDTLYYTKPTKILGEDNIVYEIEECWGDASTGRFLFFGENFSRKVPPPGLNIRIGEWLYRQNRLHRVRADGTWLDAYGVYDATLPGQSAAGRFAQTTHYYGRYGTTQDTDGYIMAGHNIYACTTLDKKPEKLTKDKVLVIYYFDRDSIGDPETTGIKYDGTPEVSGEDLIIYREDHDKQRKFRVYIEGSLIKSEELA